MMRPLCVFLVYLTNLFLLGITNPCLTSPGNYDTISTMRKTNNKVSQHKAKRAHKNKKRISANPYHKTSRFERKQQAIRAGIIAAALPM